MITAIVLVAFLQLVSVQGMKHDQYYGGGEQSTKKVYADLSPYVRSKMLGDLCFQPTSIEMQWHMNFSMSENEWNMQKPILEIYRNEDIYNYDICATYSTPLKTFELNSMYCQTHRYMSRKKRALRLKRSWNSTSKWNGYKNEYTGYYGYNTKRYDWYRSTEGPYESYNKNLNISCSGTVYVTLEKPTKLAAFIKRCNKNTYEYYNGCFEVKNSYMGEDCEENQPFENSATLVKPTNAVALLISAYIFQRI
ncbi:DgyrCDS8675 [Dimorphilus gyrociliatus]|uniref:DgyrCDS8675 n=1 Tax=Dimorphilus gyrociliatus TaxID=2664684 RepID=A0A7I8VWJ9_9ANNE|nr:DgyrCDS8675 [Dimorphilus gyrociliatus]